MARPRPSLLVVVSSSIAAAFGFLIARFVYLAGLAGLGWIEGRDPFMSHSEVVFRSAGPQLADAGGVLVVLGLGILLAVVLPGPGPYGVARLTVLWTTISLLALGLLSFVTAPFTDAGGIVLFGLDVSDTAVWLIAGVAAVALIGIGLFTGPFFLRFAPKRSLVDSAQKRTRFAALIVGVPWLVGGGIAIATLVPMEDLLIWVGLVAVVAISAIAALSASAPDPRWDPTIPRWPVVPAVLLIAFVWVFGFGLRPGIDIPPWG